MGEARSGGSASDLIETVPDRIILENDALRVTVMPSLGGKIASIQVMPDEEELLQQPLHSYTERVPYMRFDASDASGWDECLPSVAACEVPTASGTASVPDHGDFWQVAWQVESHSEDEMTLSADGFSLPLRFLKTLRLTGNRFDTTYSVTNLALHAVDYIWSAHPLFTVEHEDRIVLPPSVHEITVEGSAQERLGQHGTKHIWPVATSAKFGPSDLSRVGHATDGVGDKLFAPAPGEGWCAIERRQLRRRIEIRFDPRRLPWLGLWICYGGWPEGQEKRQYSVALEPCMSQGDSLALAASEGRARKLAPGSQEQWSLGLQVIGVS